LANSWRRTTKATAYVNDLIKANDVNEADIRATLRFLRALCEAAPLWGNLKENVGAASALRTQIEDLQATFRAMPRETLYLIFDPGTTGQDHQIPPASNQTRALGRLRRTIAILNAIRVRCIQLSADPPGKHKNVDYKKQLACGEAWDFMLRHGKQPTNSSSSTSLFRVTSNLFYEAITGEQADLEHTCRSTFERRQSDHSQKKRKL
jgi:hypothetical protein